MKCEYYETFDGLCQVQFPTLTGVAILKTEHATSIKPNICSVFLAFFEFLFHNKKIKMPFYPCNVVIFTTFGTFFIFFIFTPVKPVENSRSAPVCSVLTCQFPYDRIEA